MCDLSKGFKLCSCDGDKLNLDEIGWVLKRRDLNKKTLKIMGKPFIYQMNLDEKQIKTQTVQELNARNCFDFEYVPQEDDFLQIKVGDNNFWMAFRYEKRYWQEDTSTKFNIWRQQLEKYKEGLIEN